MLEAEWKNLYHKLYKFCFIENENKLQWPLMYTHCLEAKTKIWPTLSAVTPTPPRGMFMLATIVHWSTDGSYLSTRL